MTLNNNKHSGEYCVWLNLSLMNVKYEQLLNKYFDLP